MPIKIRCQGHGGELQVADHFQGKRIRCPKCGQVLLVPQGCIPDEVTSKDLSPTRDVLDSQAEVPKGQTFSDVSKGKAQSSLGSQPESEPVPKVLGGYAVLAELGRGGMGRVYLARQTSLDRLVALKVMDPRRIAHPRFRARFLREAYASAQLVHHNVVQTYDIGSDKDVSFYSMEYVKGESLSHLVEKQGRLDPEVAVGLLLQAARGLKFGHDMGMVHRDVKPENLLLNEHGIVKVADLGLVKIPYGEEHPLGPSEDSPDIPDVKQGLSQVTRLGVAVGTPTYMAPEQAQNAATVDARADIYSLGCTLYVLLCGKPPFEGRTAYEVMSKHQTAPLVLPEVIVKRVPKALSAILVKMLAKKPEDRYPDLGAVIADLEKYLGIQQAGTFSPREEHVSALEHCLGEFGRAPHLKLRRRALLGFAVGCALAFLVCLWFGWLRLAGGLLGLALLTPISYVLMRGWREKSYLFLKVREWALGSSWTEVAYGLAWTILLVLVLHLLGLLWLWLVMLGLALTLAIVCFVRVDRPITQERKGSIDQTEKLLRHLRKQGLDEGALRKFVCQYGGKDWEELYEALFGYEAKCKARHWLRGELGKRRNRFAPWRDPLIAWIGAQQQTRKDRRERSLLQRVEAVALQAEGMAVADAQRKADQVAEVMVHQAAAINLEIAKTPELESVVQPAVRHLMETTMRPEGFILSSPAPPPVPRRSWKPPVTRLVKAAAGAPARFLAGAVLLAGCAFWVQQNEDRLWPELTAAFEQGDWQKLDQLGQPLEVPILSAPIASLFHDFRPGVAGLILLASAFFGWKASLIAWPTVLLIFLGPTLGMPELGPFSAEQASLAIGLGLIILGWLFGKLMFRKRIDPSLIITERNAQ